MAMNPNGEEVAGFECFRLTKYFRLIRVEWITNHEIHGVNSPSTVHRVRSDALCLSRVGGRAASFAERAAGQFPGGTRSCRAYRLDVGLFGNGVIYDRAGVSTVLRRPSTQEERIERRNAMRVSDGFDDRYLVYVRLFVGI